MKLHRLAGLVAITIVQGRLLANSCLVPPPCARVRAGSILFVGLVVDAGVPDEPKDDSERDVRFQVQEVFAGLPMSSKDAFVSIRGSWFKKGHSYLIDAVRGIDNRLSLASCIASDEIGSTAGVLEFLRQRSLGKTNTSITVRVTDQSVPVPAVEVTLASSEETFTSNTGPNGLAVFDSVKPARYHISAKREHYQLETSRHANAQVEVIEGACANSSIPLRPEAEARGLVRDAEGLPVAFLELDLVLFREDPSKPMPPRQVFHTETNAKGEFRFESVTPGRYYLGTNIVDYLRTSSAPRTYYPGQRHQEGAIPIDVKLGEVSENLLFTLPDFGPPRVIQLCVADENGRPVPSASIGNDIRKKGDDFASLGAKLQTDETGCVQATGYARASYALYATSASFGSDFRQTRFSESVVVPPGEGSVRQVLSLKKPFSVQKFTKQ